MTELNFELSRNKKTTCLEAADDVVHHFHQFELFLAVSRLNCCCVVLLSMDTTGESFKRATSKAKFTLPDALIKTRGTPFCSEKHVVPNFDNLTWWLEAHPMASEYTRPTHLWMRIRTNCPVKARFKINFRKSMYFKVNKNDVTWAVPVPCAFFNDKHAVKKGRVKLTIRAHFKKPNKTLQWTSGPAFESLMTPNQPEVTLIGQDGEYKVSKHLLSCVSTVFATMFSNDTQENRTSAVKIPDITIKTITQVMNCVLGNLNHATTVMELISMMRFADRFHMDGLNNHLEHMLTECLNNDNLYEITEAAHFFSRHQLMQKCAEYFDVHHNELTETQRRAFANPLVEAALVQSALGWKWQ
uniref:BTB domain-containing protein n=1 Tax=Panagrellus redivivus TaxID=6233 RepID=A0A7E4VK54_PANRE